MKKKNPVERRLSTWIVFIWSISYAICSTLMLFMCIEREKCNQPLNKNCVTQRCVSVCVAGSKWTTTTDAPHTQPPSNSTTKRMERWIVLLLLFDLAWFAWVLATETVLHLLFSRIYYNLSANLLRNIKINQELFRVQLRSLFRGNGWRALLLFQCSTI